MKRTPVWRLRTHLSALLLASMLLTLAVVGAATMAWRLPEIERENRRALVGEIDDVTARLELILNASQSRLELVASLVRGQPAAQVRAVLEEHASANRFQALYLLAPNGRVQVAGLAGALREQGEDLPGSDLSGNALYKAVQSGRRMAWSGKYFSALTGSVTVGLAYRDNSGHVLIGEVPLPSVLRALRAAAGRQASAIWVVDRTGEVIADTDGGRHVGKINLLNWPVLQAMVQGRAPPEVFDFEQQRFQAAISHSQTLDWYFVGSIPSGWRHPGVRRVLTDVGAVFAGCLAIGLLIAPFWAQRMTRGLQSILERAALTTSGQAPRQSWPRGAVSEFNGLSNDLQTMAAALQEREQKFQAIFNALPVPMAVTDVHNADRLLDVNAAWLQALCYPRADVIGRNAIEIGLFDAQQGAQLASRPSGDTRAVNLVLYRNNGEPMPVKSFGRQVDFGCEQWLIWASIDMGPLQRIEHELRELNQLLEARVKRRTEALQASNAELSDTANQLRTAQDELVQAEKMAALGGLVAGVAHELNTPLGNGVMAVSAMADATRQFKVAMHSGVKRADLQQLVDSVEQGADIAGRNLRRAADLVHSFKQVAVDQTSAQRRSFELGEMVQEMVVSLRPSFSRTPYRIEVGVPETGLRLDSYPGALGQTIGNLIQNAVVHGFDGRDHGTVRIDAERAADGFIVLRVADDGHGVAAENLGRIFEPFMTTKMGRGGTGLGLHISYNAVTNLLGGTLTVQSVEGEGTCFELRLPVQAPKAPPPGAAAVAQGEQEGVA